MSVGTFSTAPISVLRNCSSPSSLFRALPRFSLPFQQVQRNMATSQDSQKPTIRAWQYEKAQAPLEKHMKLNENASCPPSDPLPAKQNLVQVITAALNPVDWKFPEMPIAGGLMAKPPATPAIDYCGKLLKPDPQRDDLKTGQLVFGRLDKPCQFGTIAEQTVAPSEGCAPVPNGVHPDHAASIGTAGLTAYQSLVPYLGSDPSGSRVFINGGSGGVGTWGIQIAKALGCYVSTSCSTPNVSLCQQLGADEVLDYKKVDIAEELTKNHKDTPFDLIVDAVGTPESLFKMSDVYLKPKGNFIQPGAATNFSGFTSLAGRAFRPAILGGGKRPYKFMHVANNRKDLAAVAEMVRDGRVKAIIEKKYEFGDVVKAFEHSKTGRSKGKLLVGVSSA